MNLQLAFLMSLMGSLAVAVAPKAVVYRGPAACDGCPEAVAKLLRSSPSKFMVSYVGPKEASDVTAAALSDVAVYAQPGGPDLDRSMHDYLGQYNSTIRDFVSNGGRYLGFCLGAYTAGYTPGYALLPHGIDTNEECTRPGAQVTNRKNTIIQVNWTFGSSESGKKGTTEDGRWLFFQDGAVILPKAIEAQARKANATGFEVLGTYSANGDPAAVVSPFGKGWVGVVGPHPEADRSWYTGYDFRNPDGIKFDIGHDFVETVMSK